VKLPARKLGDWARELIDECSTSRERRIEQYKLFKSYFWSGTDYGVQARYNRCGAHCDRLASYLFSPADVRFSIELDQTQDPADQDNVDAAARYLNREFHRCCVDIEVGAGTLWGLVKGATILKTVWGFNGLEPWLIQPEFFAVLREDIADLDRQEAFVHTTYMTPSAFKRTLVEHPERQSILEQIEMKNARADLRGAEDPMHQIFAGMIAPVSTTGVSSGQGQVAIQATPEPILSADVGKRLVRIDELWVQDDERQDWTTIRMIDDIVVEGRFQRRNLSGVEGQHGFHKLAPNDVDGYFWGASEIQQIYRLQDLLNDQIRDMARIIRLRADPPRVGMGFSDLTLEKYKTLRRPGGWHAESTPGAKIESLAPELPPELFQSIESTLRYFDDIAGFAPIMQGQGETGVRTQSQAQTLTRNASPRMRDRALLLERQVIDIGDFCLKLLQNKQAEVFNSEKGGQFLLSQLPEDYRVTIDSHTSSPAFMEDHRNLAFQLARFGAVDHEELIMLTHPPHEDTLRKRAKERAQAQAKMMQEHPEMFAKGKGKPKK